MPLLQDITPVNDQIMDSLASAKDRKWIELQPGMAWASVLWLARILHQFAELWLRDFAPDSCSRPKS